MLGVGRHELPRDHLLTYSIYSLLREPFTQIFWCAGPCINSIVGNCNGLLVGIDLFADSRLILWNPFTRKFKHLPKLDWICSIPESKYGFCYDEPNDDYKVFAISPAKPDYNTFVSSRVYVYSLKCDCWWRLIGDFPFRLASSYFSSPGFDDGNFANGSIYWSVTPQIQKKTIVSLDIKTETWREVLLPNFGDGVYNWTLGTFGKSLSVLCQFKDEYACADLWIMKEMQWTKLFTVPYVDQLITPDSYLKPICITKNGDIMLNLNRVVALYNPTEKTFKDLLRDQFADFKVYPYVESLVSPHL